MDFDVCGNRIAASSSLCHSQMQQGIRRLWVADLVDANTMLKERPSLEPLVKVVKPTEAKNIAIQTFSGDSHPKATCHDGCEIFMRPTGLVKDKND